MIMTTPYAEVYNELAYIQQAAQQQGTAALDTIRQKYLSTLFEKTKRPTIAYYSGWLSQPSEMNGTPVEENDVQGFYNAVRELPTNLGLDLFLHTPGGDPFVAEAIMSFLLEKFSNDIRVIVPQIAMSAGTMMACASKEIIMAPHASLGPIDPQFQGIPAQGVIEEFARAAKEIEENPARIYVWQPIIAKYPVAFLGRCECALKYTRETAEKWLTSVHLTSSKKTNIAKQSKKIVDGLIKLGSNAAHNRRLSVSMCQNLGLNVRHMSTDLDILEPFLMSVHDAFMLTLQKTPTVKIIQNHCGRIFCKFTANKN